MTELDGLRELLDAAPEPVTFWWRDDDAGRWHPRLARLLALADELEVPLALAVVPEWLDAETLTAISACRQAWVLQHGCDHSDHARAGQRKIELGGTADLGVLEARLVLGREKLARAFVDRFLPILVPPWNRISSQLAERLPDLGYLGISVWIDEPLKPVQALVRRDVGLDAIRWREETRFCGAAEITARIAQLLAERPIEPIGLMSHHLVFTDDAFRVWRDVLTLLRDHPNGRLVTPGAVFRGAA